MKEKRNAKIIKTPDLLSYSARQQKKEKLPLLTARILIFGTVNE